MPLIKRIMRENNDFCLFLISQLSIDLGIADRRLVSLTQKHLRARLAEALLFLRDTYGTDRSGRYLDIRLTREDLASLANMTTPNAIRTLISFDHEGLIVLHGRSICLLDEEALYHISDCG